MREPTQSDPEGSSVPDVVAPETLPEELMPSATGLLVGDDAEESALLAAGGDVVDASGGELSIEGPNSA